MDGAQAVTDDKWLSMDEVIEHVMRVEKCSRKVARRKVTKAVKDKKLRIRTIETDVSPLIPMPPGEAAQRLDDDPESVLTTLSDFMLNHDFTPPEMLGELQSGRLVAGASESTLLAVQLGRQVDPRLFTISYQSIIDWLKNPKTPEHLIDKFNTSLARKLQ